MSTYAPEMDTCRERLAKFCRGNVLELGHGGGRPIVDWALCLDRPEGHGDRAQCGTWPTHLAWDVSWGLPFKDRVFNAVAQSHLLEDFEDIEAVLREMVRVTVVGGCVVNFMPDEQVYREHCRRTGQPYNEAHKHADMSLGFMRKIVCRIPNVKIVHELFPVPNNAYSFDLVLERTA
jgi:SAM-dependent methyltransferase